MMYTMMKKMILGGNYDKVDVTKKLDIFLAKDRISIEQYTELYDLMEKDVEKE